MNISSALGGYNVKESVLQQLINIKNILKWVFLMVQTVTLHRAHFHYFLKYLGCTNTQNCY